MGGLIALSDVFQTIWMDWILTVVLLLVCDTNDAGISVSNPYI